ncbi:hypothetical protein P7K49_025101 [Saguinus oedipus]|uniref:Uncharacterized protein n=1 Tax=Saguinus oedipus TaxID=9490 RepID=A0ABQ9UIF8_SAGOE|nr:hypothetical protein P7K49_025101 [Saguinus oedipus]
MSPAAPRAAAAPAVVCRLPGSPRATTVQVRTHRLCEAHSEDQVEELDGIHKEAAKGNIAEVEHFLALSSKNLNAPDYQQRKLGLSPGRLRLQKPNNFFRVVTSQTPTLAPELGQLPVTPSPPPHHRPSPKSPIQPKSRIQLLVRDPKTEI